MDNQTLEQTFNTLMHAHYNEIFHYIRKQTSNTEDAKDLTQDVFMKVYSKLHTYNKDLASIRTWVYRIAHNHVINHFNQAAFKYNVKGNDDFIYVLSDTSDILADMIQREDVEMIISLMHNLFKKKHVSMLNLYFFSDLSVKEIADTLKTPEKTVYNTINLSIKKLKKEMEAHTHG